MTTTPRTMYQRLTPGALTGVTLDEYVFLMRCMSYIRGEIQEPSRWIGKTLIDPDRAVVLWECASEMQDAPAIEAIPDLTYGR